MLDPQGKVRDTVAHPPATWPGPQPGSVQPHAWLLLGYNFQSVIESVHPGRGMVRPLTKYHGEQIVLLFTKQHLLWDAMETELNKLRAHPEFRCIVDELQRLWAAMGECHRQIHLPPSQLSREVLETNIGEVEVCLRFFEENVLRPCSYKLKAYDHILIKHMLSEVDKLAPLKLSPVSVSSRFIEAGNKHAKAMFRRMPGGGKEYPDKRNRPVVQVFRKLVARYKMERVVYYQDLGMSVTEHADAEQPGTPVMSAEDEPSGGHDVTTDSVSACSSLNELESTWPDPLCGDGHDARPARAPKVLPAVHSHTPY